MTSGDEPRATYDAVCNWGRWGPEDERGTLNLVGAGQSSRAARLVSAGRTVGCGHIDEEPSVLNTRPPLHHMLDAGDSAQDGCSIAADFIGIAPHGPTATHIDALCHIFFDGTMYNGRPASLVGTSGATVNTVAAMSDGVVTRGVLLDVTEVRAEPYLDPADAVGAADLDRAARRAGVEPGPGDAVLVRVGRAVRRERLGVAAERTPEGALHVAGLGADCLAWLHERDIAVLGSDGGNDVLPSPPTRWRLPIHVGCIVFMGLPLIDNMDLESLHRACRRFQRWEFLFTVAPLTFARATGSPVNPIAVF